MSGGSRVSIPNNVRKTIQNIKEIAGNHSDDEIYAMLKECSMDPHETAQKLLQQVLNVSGGSRVSIPNNVRKTIQNIKEIAGNHSDDEIYAMLKECSMDPNETVQKLLHQDPFHEVRRKRDKKKENVNNREPADSRWRTGTQGRGGRGGRGNYFPRYISYDFGGRSASAGKENGVNQGSEKGVTPSSLLASEDTENKATIPITSPVSITANGLTNVTHVKSTNPLESLAVDVNKLGSEPPVLPPPPVNENSTPPSEFLITHGQATPELLPSPVSMLGVSSVSDPVLVPSLDSRLPGAVGTIKREVGNQWIAIESNATIPVQSKLTAGQNFTNRLQNKFVSRDVINSELSSSMIEKVASEIGNSFMNAKMPSKSQGVERKLPSESSQPSSSAILGGTSTSRPSSNYGNRSQQPVGSQKAIGPSKEWKPKPTNPNSAPTSGTVGTSEEVVPIAVEASVCSLPTLNFFASEEAKSNLQKKLDELHFSDSQHVIIPNHLHVPEAARTGLSFGSFDASFGVSKIYANGPDTEKTPTPLSESSQGFEETTEEPSSSNQNASPTAHEGDYADHSQSPMNTPENLSPVEAEVSSSTMPDYDHSKPETALPLGGPQYSVVHSTSNYSTIGLMPPMLGTQFSTFDSSESQARDVSRLPSFVVQQPFDPSASYYSQFYRPSADGDGRFSPFLAPGTATKYNGNIAVLSPQSAQSPQESMNSLVLSTAGPTPHVSQAAGVMQSSIAVNQQPIPVFRQAGGVHMPHYPPNYIPYSQYFSPFYVPPPTIHHFLSNAAFPQQPPAGNIYPPPSTAAGAQGIKYSLSQYKPGTNAGNSTHIGMPTGYAPYSSSPAGYSPAATMGDSSGNEDLAAQYKENNVYITGQQSEGSAVWIPAPGREISGMQASSFYNLSPQGQHVTFAPTQAGHGAFTGIYHPSQTVAAATVHPLLQQSQTMSGAVEMVGTPAGVYPQPQRAQINWTNNY